MNNKKNILISASDSKISKLLSNSLKSHHLKFIDKKELEYDDPNKLNKLFKDIDVYVHINYQGLNFSDDYEMIDYHTRKTYDLLGQNSIIDIDAICGYYNLISIRRFCLTF